MRTLLCCALLMMLQTGAAKIEPQPGCRIWDPYCQPAIGHELMDLPAVKLRGWEEVFGPPDENDPHIDFKIVDHVGYVQYWTCTDTSRVLLRSEDGTRHCIKFPQGATQ